ncbi:MAG: ABC transporter substrate-binding protein [Egibacteraceae bacterium]
MRQGSKLAWLLALVLFAAACSGGGEGVEGEGLEDGGGGGTEAGAAGTEASGGTGGGTLVAAISSQPDQLDPHKTTAYASFQVLENVYDTLVVPNTDLEFEPSLATEWATSDDNLTWTFTLRDDVTFHDGSTFDSADVAYSFNRIISQELANAFRFASVKEIRTPDPQTVEIELTEPTPNLLANIGGFKGMAIIPEGIAGPVSGGDGGGGSEAASPSPGGSGADINLANEAVGTGPFALESVAADGITLSAFQDYWGEGPNVDGVEFRFISEPTTALTELQTGNVHWTDNIPPQRITELANNDEVTLETIPSVDYWYWATNFNREPFGNPKVREALSYAIDREAITQAAKFDAATVNQTAIPETSFWSTDYSPYSHDPERAQQLLEEAGVSNLSMGLMVTDEFPETVTAAEVIASQLGEVGINVEIQSETFATWLDRQGKGDFDAFMLGWLGNLDPFGYYHSQHLCEGSNNYQGYCNEEVDKLLQQAATQTDQDQRKQLYDEAVKLIVDDNSYMYLYNPDVAQAWKPGLSGYTIRPDKAINFEQVELPQ